MQKTDSQEMRIFDDLYVSFYVPVFRYAYCRMKNRDEAEDIAQSVFLKVFEYNRLDGYRNLTLGYFFTIARNKIIDRQKKKKELYFDFSAQEFTNISDNKKNAQVALEEREKEIEILSKLEFLNPEQKEVLILKFVTGLGNSEIADIMDKTEEAVRQIQSRALRKLRDLME